MSDEEKGFTVRDRRIKAEGDELSPAHSTPQREEPRTQPTERITETDKPIALTFTTFLFSLGSSAFIALGEEANPFTGQKSINLPQAQESIDLLSILQEKTRGNLTGEEESLLNNLLFSLRMKYVELARKQGQPKG
jgi:hypothetical protein